MPGFVAAKIVGLEADDQDEAWDRAMHEDGLGWEVAAVCPQEVAHRAVEAVVDATTPVRATRKQWCPHRALGWASVVTVPMMAFGAITDASSTRTLFRFAMSLADVAAASAC